MNLLINRMNKNKSFQSKYAPTEYKYIHKNKCTCELGNIKALGKKALKFSVCDVCSEKLFSDGELTSDSSNNFSSNNFSNSNNSNNSNSSNNFSNSNLSDSNDN